MEDVFLKHWAFWVQHDDTSVCWVVSELSRHLPDIERQPNLHSFLEHGARGEYLRVKSSAFLGVCHREGLTIWRSIVNTTQTLTQRLSGVHSYAVACHLMQDVLISI